MRVPSLNKQTISETYSKIVSANSICEDLWHLNKIVFKKLLTLTVYFVFSTYFLSKLFTIWTVRCQELDFLRVLILIPLWGECIKIASIRFCFSLYMAVLFLPFWSNFKLLLTVSACLNFLRAWQNLEGCPFKRLHLKKLFVLFRDFTICST